MRYYRFHYRHVPVVPLAKARQQDVYHVGVDMNAVTEQHQSNAWPGNTALRQWKNVSSVR